MLVLGLDPSSTSTGYGLIEIGSARRFRYADCGCIRPPGKMSFEDRLVYFYDRMREIVVQWDPGEVAVESTFYGKDARASSKLDHARGVLILAARQAGKPINHYTPAQVKKAIAGSGQASKEQVQLMISRMLALKEMPTPLDASDALAIALCHIHQMRLRPAQGTGKRKPEIEALLQRMTTR